MERRAEERYQVRESVVVSVLGPPPQHRPATLLDISKSGFQFISGMDLHPGTEILTTLNSVAIFGIVRHCRLTSPDSYTAGARIRRVVPAIEGTPPEEETFWDDMVDKARSGAESGQK